MPNIVITSNTKGLPLNPKRTETQSQKMARTSTAMRFNKVGPGKRGPRSKRRK